MQGAVDLVGCAIDEGRRIVVHGDYDADGITATALMLLGLREFGVEAEWYLPNRFEEGYGLSRRAVETIAAKGPGVLVTVDCGVNYPDEVALAQSLGLDTVVVDHHQPGPILPECHLVHSVAGEYPHEDLCGVGLAFKVMHALHIARKGAAREVVPEALAPLLDLVAVGTIADLASLRGENRYFVREGLKLIEIGQRVGLRALAQVSGCTGAVDSGTVAYRLAPRLNAAGRLADPSPPLRLLLTDDEREATALAAELHELNGARQDVERLIFEQAMRQVEALRELPSALVLAAEEWHEGVVGIVASRLVERYHRPTILLGIREGVAKGSGRSISSYDLLSGLTACRTLLDCLRGPHPGRRSHSWRRPGGRVSFGASKSTPDASSTQVTWCPSTWRTRWPAVTSSTPTPRRPWLPWDRSAAAIRGRGCSWSMPRCATRSARVRVLICGAP